MDCFDLARDIRVLDMRASPYDLSARGYQPIPIETREGKAEYVEAQRAFSPARRTSVAGCSTRPPPRWPPQPPEVTSSASSRRLVMPSFV